MFLIRAHTYVSVTFSQGYGCTVQRKTQRKFAWMLLSLEFHRKKNPNNLLLVCRYVPVNSVAAFRQIRNRSVRLISA